MHALILAVLLALSPALGWAQDAPPGGCAGVTMENGNTRIGCANRLNLAQTPFVVTCSGGECLVDLRDAVTQLGQFIGDVSTDFGDPTRFDGITIDAGDAFSLELPNSTTVPGTCSVGQIYIESDGDLAQKMFLCESANTYVQQGDISTDGRSGGQIINGGAATATDALKLRANASTAPTGGVEMCGGSGLSFGATDSECMQLIPEGLTVTTASHTLLSVTSTVTNSGATNVGELKGLNFSPTIDVTSYAGGGAFAMGATGYRFAPTYQNSATGTIIPSTFTAIKSAPSCQKAGSGSNFTLGAVSMMESNLGTIGSGCTVTDFYAGLNVVSSGTVSGTLTNWWGSYVAPLTLGSNRFQYGAGEMARSAVGTVPSGKAVWFVESGAPNRLSFKNESGHVWSIGYTSWTGNAAALASNTTTVFFPVNQFGATASTTEGNHDIVVPGAVSAFAMTCGLSVAPNNGASTQTRTFTLMDDTVATALACTISETATSCTDREDTTPVAIAATSLVDLRSEAANGGGSAPLGSDVTCTVFYTVDAF